MTVRITKVHNKKRLYKYPKCKDCAQGNAGRILIGHKVTVHESRSGVRVIEENGNLIAETLENQATGVPS